MVLGRWVGGVDICDDFVTICALHWFLSVFHIIYPPPRSSSGTKYCQERTVSMCIMQMVVEEIIS